MGTHTLFTRSALDRLKRRISELVQENIEEKNNFKVTKLRELFALGTTRERVMLQFLARILATNRPRIQTIRPFWVDK